MTHKNDNNFPKTSLENENQIKCYSLVRHPVCLCIENNNTINQYRYTKVFAKQNCQRTVINGSYNNERNTDVPVQNENEKLSY